MKLHEINSNDIIAWFINETPERQAALMTILNYILENEEYKISLRHLVLERI